MLVASFDIGIKNLAYCMLSYSPYETIKYPIAPAGWDVINLLDSDAKGYTKCCKCDKDSYYKYKDLAYCKMHLRPSEEILLQCTRTFTVENIEKFEIATQLVRKLDTIDFGECDAIIIEQQPSKNPSMTHVSMMLMNYFVIRYIVERQTKIKSVDFINSTNKLKVYDGPYIECNLKTQYSRNKFYGKEFCRYLIQHDSPNLEFFNSHKKRDDLSDCFLQGAWYLISNYKDPESRAKARIAKKPTSLVGSTESTNDTPKIKITLKPHVELKDKTKLDAIQQSDTHKHIMHDMHSNRYKQLRFGRKPKINQTKHSLAEIKYIHEHKLPLTENITRSIQFFFGSIEEFHKRL